MLPRVLSLNSCTILSVINVVGCCLFARFAESLGFVGDHAFTWFSVTIGVMTMLVTAVLLVWSAVDHFLIEPTGHTAFAVSVNLGFFCAFMLI